MYLGPNLPRSAHTDRPWRIHEIAPDFRVEDVWALPTPGGPDDFPRLLEAMQSIDPSANSPVVAALFAIRWKLGEWLGWDDEKGDGSGGPTLRDRLPADLRDPPPVTPHELPFKPLYATGNEAAAEIANQTMHGILHLGWVPDGDGGYRGQMAVLVRRNGLFGAAYMAAITPFRYAIVYPQMLRTIGRTWQARG
jgi:Protein of unknown function (DUF2867)